MDHGEVLRQEIKVKIIGEKCSLILKIMSFGKGCFQLLQDSSNVTCVMQQIRICLFVFHFDGIAIHTYLIIFNKKKREKNKEKEIFNYLVVFGFVEGR